MLYAKAEKIIDGEKYVLKIERDNDVFESPREWDNLGTMVCWHGRYNLGDEHNFDNEEEMIVSLASDYITDEFINEKMEKHFKDYHVELNDDEEWAILDGDVLYDEGFEDQEEAEERLEELKDEFVGYYLEDDEYYNLDDLWELIDEHYVILPLYLYDHSGITMNTSGFSCRWDNGQVGYIYASKDTFRKETSYNEKELFEEGMAENMLKGEVKVYDQYLRGDVLGFVIEKEVKCDCCRNVKYEHVDSCWGFYGNEFDNNGWDDMKEYIEEKLQTLFDDLTHVY